MKKRLLITTILLILLTGFFIYRIKIKNLWLELTKESLPTTVDYQTQVNQQRETDKITTSSLAIKSWTNSLLPTTNSQADSQAAGLNQLPAAYNLEVPFTSQAPLANWNETFKEACEEAASLIVHYYYQQKTFTPNTATDEILKMVDWQINQWGGHFDLTASQTAEMIKEYWGYAKVEIINNPSINDIKWQIFQGRPVIVPAAGRELANPYFRQPGPIYHMLVIKGYTEKKFITNDPGTKRGADFLYDYEVLMNAIHDWYEEDILKGEKKIIVIYPN